MKVKKKVHALTKNFVFESIFCQILFEMKTLHLWATPEGLDGGSAGCNAVTPETRFTPRLLPVVKPTKALLCRFRDFSGPEPGSEQNQETVIMLQVVQVEPGVRNRLSDKRHENISLTWRWCLTCVFLCKRLSGHFACFVMFCVSNKNS